MTRLPVLLTLACLLLAGCSGDPDPASQAGKDTDPPAAAGDRPVAAAGSDAAASGEPVATREEPLAFQGTSPVGGCAGVYPVIGQCYNNLGDHQLQPLGDAGSPLVVNGTLTWSAATPATETMSVLVLVPYEGCDGCWTSAGDLPYVYGASPLQVDFDLSGIGEPVALWISSYQGFAQQGAWVGASVPQAFSFEGVVTHVDG